MKIVRHCHCGIEIKGNMKRCTTCSHRKHHRDAIALARRNGGKPAKKRSFSGWMKMYLGETAKSGRKEDKFKKVEGCYLDPTSRLSFARAITT
jgi:hypothetical protein